MNKILCFFFLLLSVPVFAQQVQVTNLSCNYKTNPLGVTTQSPKLTWKIQSNQYNVLQTAYQILVADHLALLEKNTGNIWDSKKVNSSQSIQVDYKGPKLISNKKYYWKVKVYTNQNNSACSQSATWQMGLFNQTDWQGAKWIAYEKLADSNINILPTDGKKDTFKVNNILPMLRKGFTVAKPIKKASLYISGLGHFEASLNGKKIGDHFLAPGWTKYDKEALYVTFDVTKQLQRGQNVLGVMLGNGFYYIPPVSGRYRKLKVAFGYPKMIARLVLEYADGTTANVVSNETWKTAPSPITFSSIYGGEDYNANLEQKGWDQPGFNDSRWKKVLIVDGPRLHSQQEEPVKIFEHFEAKTITQYSKTGDWIYDLGQNASGIISLSVSGKKGDTVKITPAELLKEDVSVNQKASGSPYYFTYVLKGDGTETWQPRFSYYGFRYLQVKGATPAGKPKKSNQAVILNLKGLHIRNAATKVGSFTSSNQLFNQTYQLIDWAVKSNMVSVFTDCPQREKLGWLEQLHLMGNSINYNYAAAPIFKKSLTDMQNSQLANGLVPEIAPEYVKFEWGGDMFRDSPEWGSSCILVPWDLYEFYGDKDALIANYEVMKRYITYLGSKANKHILTQGLGDWYDLGPNAPGVSQLTPMGVTATAIYYHDLTTLTKIANLLGKADDAKNYQSLAIAVRKAFNAQFFNADTKQYATGSQTANAMAIYMQLVNEKDKAAVLTNLVNGIKQNNNSLTAGDIGYRYLLKVLANEGRSDVVFDMNSRSDVPGYGMQIAKGATALTESWAALPTVSNNHSMLGHLMEWFYTGVGGIQQEDGSIAFNKIKIYPEVVGDLTSASTSFQSPYGKISTSWQKLADQFTMQLTIPANTTATVYLPAKATQEVLSAQKYMARGYENGRIKISIGSGVYQFKIQ